MTKHRRYQVQYGTRPQKGYIVIDAGPNGLLPVSRSKVLLTTDNKGEAIKFADDLNAKEVNNERS